VVLFSGPAITEGVITAIPIDKISGSTLLEKEKLREVFFIFNAYYLIKKYREIKM
jgi:hypothetical protein